MAVYTSEAHNLIKAMGKAGITFPATKAELLEKFGDMTIKVDFDKEAKISDTVKEWYLRITAALVHSEMRTSPHRCRLSRRN